MQMHRIKLVMGDLHMGLKIKISQDWSDALEEEFLVPQRTSQWTVLKGTTFS